MMVNDFKAHEQVQSIPCGSHFQPQFHQVSLPFYDVILKLRVLPIVPSHGAGNEETCYQIFPFKTPWQEDFNKFKKLNSLTSRLKHEENSSQKVCKCIIPRVPTKQKHARQHPEKIIVTSHLIQWLLLVP